MGGLLITKTANETLEDAKREPIPKMLFSEFFHQGELCVLFADTNQGKSVLAVNIADSISKGVPLNGFKLEAPAQPVLYFDFELSDKQFENRYSEDYKNHYTFSDNFYRSTINSDYTSDYKTFEKELSEEFERQIVETGASVVIIDNITWLKSDNEKAREAAPFVKLLKGLKTKHNLSMLMLAHTPKRDNTRPLTINDLQGSKMIANFIDSCFAIGRSTNGSETKYLIQLKARSTQAIYDSSNVVVCSINKCLNYLSFEFCGYSNEREHLKEWTSEDQQELESKVVNMRKEGKSTREISKELGGAISHTTAGKIIKKHSQL